MSGLLRIRLELLRGEIEKNVAKRVQFELSTTGYDFGDQRSTRAL
jgi:hypothetical protein